MGLPSSLFLSGIPTKTLYTFIFSPICATYPTQLILLDLITQMILVRSTNKAPHISVSSSLLYFLPLSPTHFPSTLFLNTLRLFSSLMWETDRLPHAFKTTGKIIVLYISLRFICPTSCTGRCRGCVYMNLYLFIQQTGRLYALNGSSIPWIHSALNFFMHAILIC